MKRCVKFINCNRVTSFPAHQNTSSSVLQAFVPMDCSFRHFVEYSESADNDHTVDPNLLTVHILLGFNFAHRKEFMLVQCDVTKFLFVTSHHYY